MGLDWDVGLGSGLGWDLGLGIESLVMALHGVGAGLRGSSFHTSEVPWPMRRNFGFSAHSSGSSKRGSWKMSAQSFARFVGASGTTGGDRGDPALRRQGEKYVMWSSGDLGGDSNGTCQGGLRPRGGEVSA